ncbi:hypothetical protein [Acidiphilium sp.]|uniref:hypothetical protein n=1 Tax=Acidiphilium sp. TaxID=527 RepID=UPI003D056470
MLKKTPSYRDVLAEALSEFQKYGYDSDERLDYWLGMLREAIERDMPTDFEVSRRVRTALETITQRFKGGGWRKSHPGLRDAAIDRVGHQLSGLLERRILASADLIKINRKKAVDQTVQRFVGLATSIPPGGTRVMDKREAKARIGKSIQQMTFEERRVVIDQGHKLLANINQTVAEGDGAIALIWRSNWRVPGYDYRQDHKERDGHCYLMRGNWATAKGLVKPGPDGYYDTITAVGEEPFCQCHAEFVYDLGDLPRDMLTKKGLAAIA